MPVDVRVTGRFESARALKQVELVVNGAVTDTFDANYKKFLDIDVTVRIRETSWIALRHYAYDYGNFMPNDWAVAHPTPALVLLDGDGLTSKISAGEALLKIDMLDALLDTSGFPGPAESLSVQSTLAAARSGWTARADSPPEPFHLADPPWGAYITTSLPTLSWHPALDADLLDTLSYRLLAASDAAFQAIIADVSGIADTFWTFPASLAVGDRIYWRVRADDGRGARRWAEEIDRWFRVSTVTGVGEEENGNLFRFSPLPNPAKGDVVFRAFLPGGHGGTVTVYNAAGREVRTFHLPPGKSETVWDGRNGDGRKLPGGIYFSLLVAGDRMERRKIVLVP